MDMIHAKLRHIIESNSSEEGVSSCSSVAGDEIHDSGVPGSFSWFRSEEATSLDALHCVGCESLLVPQGVQELPYRWVLAGYQALVVRVEPAASRPLQGVPHLDWEIWCQASCCSDRCSNPCFLKVSQERKLVVYTSILPWSMGIIMILICLLYVTQIEWDNLSNHKNFSTWLIT